MDAAALPSGDRADADRSRRRAFWTAAVRHPVTLVRRTGVRHRRPAVQAPEGGVPTSAEEVLRRLAALPVSTWSYAWDGDQVRHLGPMAQDFAAAFGLGDDDRVIDPVDAFGVLAVSVQALHRRVRAVESELALLRSGDGAG